MLFVYTFNKTHILKIQFIIINLYKQQFYIVLLIYDKNQLLPVGLHQLRWPKVTSPKFQFEKSGTSPLEKTEGICEYIS